jgi:hypothetical protein
MAPTAIAVPEIRFVSPTRDFRYWQIVLKKSFSGEERKF